ncbi:restriction endonuclease subunit S [Bifidobacterium pseudolongum]|uniref:restriction endonuclease subunit S n=1 Tax=Bifidobacterium pseudolongum TaxID=1694 RepID=UPI00101ECBEF|nr:restriction endonuclease subunit S [Bifidobacterium pseudolongum]
MKQYSLYKDSGVPWIGKIPISWGIRRLKSIASLQGGGTPSRSVAKYWDGDIPWVSSAEVKTDIINDTSQHITEEAVGQSSANIIPAGSLVMVVRSGILKHTIPVAILGRAMAINQDIKAFNVHDIKASYLKYLFNGCNDALLTILRKDATTVDNLDVNLLLDCQLPLPPMGEQEKIVTYLDVITNSIDIVIRKTEDSIMRLREYRQSLINEAVTKGLHPNASMKDSGVPWVGEIPAAWRVERLRFLGTLSGGGADKKVREGEALFHAAHYMNVYSAASKTLNPATFLKVSLPQEKAKALKLDVGDVLFTSSSETPEDIGHAAVVTEPLPEDSVYGYHLVRFRPASGVYDPSFERYFFESEAARTWLQYRANGITRYGVIGIDYSDYPALVPPIDEQRLIANYLDEKASAIDAAIQGAEESIVRLREYRQSLINEAVTGKIKVLGVEE